MSQEYEGWGVRARVGLLGLAVFVTILVGGVVAAGSIYKSRYAAQTRAIPIRFPAPVLETIDTAPRDPHEVPAPQPPAGIARAMAETVARGDRLWAASQ